jgi:NAD(P)-dependent dehydrogenase (short-subunit alcohol dehydrogenase family)
MINLTNKKALVTGVSGNIGQAVAENLLSKNIEVYGIDKKEPHFLLNHFVYASLGKGNLPTFILEDKNFDYIIHIAGGADSREIASKEITEDSELIQATFENNLLSAIDVVLATKNKINANGSITFISSINAYVDYGLPIYSATKAALEGLMNGLLPELSEDLVRINVAALGSVFTDTIEELYKNDKERLVNLSLDIPKGITPHTPVTVANEIVDVALGNQTGQVFLLDKGQMEYKRNNRNIKSHTRF